jgi:hypothetical protein
MTFQDIDFHVELYKAYCEPPGAQIEYLNRIRKKGGYKNEGFILKLDEAFKNLEQAFEIELSHKKSRIIDPEFLNSFGFPISGLNRYSVLIPFSTNFTGHISKVTLVHLTELINQFKIHSTVKKVSKILNEIESNSHLQSKTQESDKQDSLKNTFNSMPIEQVRDHFKPLTEKENQNGKIWMSNDDFEIFIQRSFGGNKELSKPKINIGSIGKGAIIKLFHQFYSESYNGYFSLRNKEPFLNLLKNAFDTIHFEKVRIDNFKGDNSKSQYKWD